MKKLFTLLVIFTFLVSALSMAQIQKKGDEKKIDSKKKEVVQDNTKVPLNTNNLNNSIFPNNPMSPDAVSTGFTFSSSSGTYTAITGGTVVGTSTDDDGVYGAMNIGFTFTYDGVPYTQIGLNTNGWISLGAAVPSNSYLPISTGATNNIITAVGKDLMLGFKTTGTITSGSNVITAVTNTTGVSIGSPITTTSGIPAGTTVTAFTANTITISANATANGTGRVLTFSNGETRYETIGSAPNRTLVVQWTRARRYSGTATQTYNEVLNFQIRLNETSNTVEIVYGSQLVNSVASITVQVGLRGASNSDYNNRTTATNWSATTAGASNSATCIFSSTIKPAVGQTYTWTPLSGPFVPTVTTTAITGITTTTASSGGNVTSDGGASITARGVCWSTTINPTISDSKTSETGATGSFTSTLTPLSPATSYHVRAYATNSQGTSYGSDIVFTTACNTISSFPWTEYFDAVTIPAFPSCWLKENGDWVTTNNANSTYDADAHSGTQFLRETYTATNEYMWSPPFQLTAGSTYDFSFWWAGDTYAGWTGDVFVNSTQVSTGATQLGTSFVTSGTTTTKTYAQVTNSFTPVSSGTYYFAIRVNATSAPWYLSFDDFSLNVQSTMAYTSSTTTQNTNQLPINASNQQIIGIQVVTTGSTNPVSASDFALNTNGTTAPATDITNAKIYYTGTSSTFSTTSQFGSTVASPNGDFNISGSQTLAQGTNYFWLTYDIPSSATPDNNADAECTQVTIGSAYTPTITAPAGVRQIIGPLAGGTYTVGTSAFNKATGRNLYEQTVTRKINSANNTKSSIKEENKTSKNENIASKESLRNESSDRNMISQMTMTSINGNSDNNIINNSSDETITVLYENGKPYEGPLYFYPEKKDNTTKKVDNKSSRLKSGEFGNDQPNAVYATITAALSDLNTRGISGAVIFSLIDASYGSETLPLTINNVTGGSATNTVTISPASGVLPTISSASFNGAIFKLNGADYVTIDGSNNGTTSRDLTISNTNTGTSTCAIWIGTASTSDGASNNTIKNCNFTGSSSTTTIAGIIIGSGVTFGNAGETPNNNNTIQNNTFKSFQNGVYHSGIATYDQNLVIAGNTFGSSVAASKLGFRGMILQNVQNFSVTGNTILGVVSSATSSSTMTGIQIGGNINGGTISKNSISDIKQINTTGWGSNGIYLNAASTASNLTVSNNIIYDVASYGYSVATQSDNGYGIMVNAGGGYNIYNNSINLATNQTSTTGIPACINVSSAIVTAGTLDIRNNVFANNQTLGTYCYAIYSGAASSVYSNLNNNNYYSPNANGRLGYIGATTYSNLAVWATATGKDQFSVSGDPGFTSATNLIPDPANANSWVLSGNGTHIASVTDDFVGGVRPADVTEGAPDIGAYEFTAGSSTPNTFTITPVAGSNNIFVNGRKLVNLNFGVLGGISSIAVQYYSGITPPGMDGYPSATFMNGYFKITPTGGSGFTYDITYYYSPSQRGTVVNENLITISKSDNNGTNWDSYTVAGTGSGNYELNTTTKTIKIYGLSSFSIFTSTGSDSPLPVLLSSFSSALSGRDVKLTWKTEKETNNAGFDVERKLVGTNDWKKAGFVTGKGNSNAPASYTFEDKKLNSGKYNYRLKQIDYNGNFAYHNLTTAVDVALPTKFNLSQNYPNPFNPTTKIDFDLPFDSKVNIVLYDLTGREVKTLVNDSRTAGFHTVQFNASDLSSGTYFYRIITKSASKDFVATKKMVLIK